MVAEQAVTVVASVAVGLGEEPPPHVSRATMPLGEWHPSVLEVVYLRAMNAALKGMRDELGQLGDKLEREVEVSINDNLITEEEAAERLGVSVAAVRASGIPFIRLNRRGRRFYSWTTIVAWMVEKGERHD